MEHDDKVTREAQERMAALAQMLAAKLGPIEAAGVLLGPVVTLLERWGGRQFVSDYFHELADQILERPGPSDAAPLN
jgi:hypothetical protein